MSNFGPDDFEAAMDGFAVADSLVRALVGVGRTAHGRNGYAAARLRAPP